MYKYKFNSIFNYIVTSVVICASNLLATDVTIYHSQTDKSAEQAAGYSKTNQSLGRYLAYRDIPFFLDEYAHGKKTLDYGAGTGISIQFLLDQNLDVTGVDISEEMLSQAVVNYPNTSFHLIKNGHIPLDSNTQDIIFSSLVLFELGSEQDMLKYLEEAKRVMKDDGIFIAVTGSQDMYSKDWFVFKVDYPENKNLKSGDLAKIYLCDADIEFTDFYWTEADYRHFFSKSGFELIKIHYPLGKEEENCPWKDEKQVSPFVVFIAKKKGL